MHARLKHFLCILLSAAVFASGIPMHNALAMNVTGAGNVTRGSLYDDEIIGTTTALVIEPTPMRGPASASQTSNANTNARATEGAVEVIRSACRDARQVRYTKKMRGPDGQNVFYRYIVAENKRTFDCRGVGVGPVKTIPKTEAGLCENCDKDAAGGPAQSLEQIAAQAALVAPQCPNRTPTSVLKNMFAGQACMANAVKGVISALVDMIKGIGYLVGSAISWVKGKFFGTPAVHTTDNAMTKVMNFFRTMSRAKLLSIMKNTGAWIRNMAIALKDSIWESAKNTATCEKWSGVPLASECKVKGPGWDCMSNYQKMQTACSLVGAVGSDIALLFVGGVGVGKLVARSARLMQFVNATKTFAAAAVRTTGRAVAAGGRGTQIAARVVTATASFAGGTVVFSGKTVLRALAQIDRLPLFKQYAHASEQAFMAGFKIGNRTAAGSVRAIDITARAGQVRRASEDVATASHSMSTADLRAMTPPPPPNARPLESTAQAQTRLRTSRDFKAPKTTPQKFEARNKGRSVIPETENNRFRSQLPDPQPGGRTVVIRDEAQASNRLNLSSDRSAAITSSMVERSALKFEQLAKKYKGEVNVTRFEGPNRIEVRVDPVRGTRLPDSIETEIADIYKSSVIEHTEFLKQNKLVRPNDDPTSWFKYGSGPDSHTANLTATGSRKLKGNFETNRWEDAMTQTQLETVFKRAQTLNKNLRESYRGTPLFNADGRLTPHIANIISRSKSAEELIEKLKPYKFLEKDASGRPLTQAEKIARAEELMEYVQYARNFGVDYYGVRGLSSTDEVCSGPSAEICLQIGRNLSHNAEIFDGEYGDIVSASVRAENEAALEYDSIVDSAIGSRSTRTQVDPLLEDEDLSTIIRNQDGTPAQELTPEMIAKLANCKNDVGCLRETGLPARVETVIDGKTYGVERPQLLAITNDLKKQLAQRISAQTKELDGVNFQIEVSSKGRMTLSLPMPPQATRAETIAAYEQLLKARREFQSVVENYPNQASLRGLKAAPADHPLGPRQQFPDGQDAFRFSSYRQAFDSQLTLPRQDGSQSFIRSVEIYPDADQKIRGMAFLLDSHNIRIVQGERRLADGSATRILGRDDKYLFIPDEVMASDAAMIAFLEKNTKDLRLDPSKVTPDAARLLENAYERQGIVPFEIKSEDGIHGLSKSNNVIGINLAAGENSGGVVIHELTHNSAVKKLEALKLARPPKNATPEQLIKWQKSIDRERIELTGRLMQFESENPFGNMGPYSKSYRADEVEARWRQIAYDQKNGVEIGATVTSLKEFINLQGVQILRMNAVPTSEWKLVSSSPGFSRLSADGIDFTIDIKYVKGATLEEQVKFAKTVLEERYSKLRQYNNRLITFGDRSRELPVSVGKQTAFVERAVDVPIKQVILPRIGSPVEIRARQLLISQQATPQLLGLNQLLKEKNIELVRATARFRNGSEKALDGRIGGRIFVPDSALKDNETLTQYLLSQTKDIRITRGSVADDSVEVVLKNGKVRKMPSTDAIIESAFNRQGITISDFTKADDLDGLSLGRNYIEVDRSTPDLGTTVIHEVTHNTSTEKFKRLLNAEAPEGLSNDQLAKWFKGYRRNLKEYTMRNLDFAGAGSERLGSAYKAGHRADEVEARIKEIGFQRSRNQDPSLIVTEALDFIDVQQDKIYYANVAGSEKWTLKPEGSYGARVSFNTPEGKEIAIVVPYVEGLTDLEQKTFINDLFTARMKVLRGYKDRLKKNYPNLKASPAVANDVADAAPVAMRGEQPSSKRSDSNLIGFSAEDAPPMVMPDRANRPARPIQTVREAAAEIRRRPGYNVRRMGVKRFVENNRARPIISKAEQKRFREVMENPHPEGRTVVIRDFDKKKNNTTYGLDRSTAITTTLVERAAIRYQKIATKYADDVTMVRFEGPNRLEVRFEPKPGKHLPATLEAELADVFKFSVVEHADFLHQNQLVRATDNPTETFKYGSGPDSHAANLTARSNREFDNQLATYRWEDPATQTQMQTVFAHAKSLHKKIKEQYKGTDLIVKETGRIDPTLADIIAKSDTPEAIIENLREYNVLSRDNKGRFLSREEQLARARELDEYVESARNLGIEYYGERTPLNLKTDDTVCFGSDLCGQNGRNLSHNTSILDGEFDDVVAASVRAEKASTDEFNVLIDNTIAARKRTFEEQGFKVRSMRSGDDISMTIENPDGTPVVELDEKALREVGSCTDGVACLRDTYVPAKVETMIKGRRAVRDKQVIIDKTHDLEKALKKTLPKRYKKHNFHIAVDKDGVMTLIMSSPKQMTESQFLQHAADEEMARRAFADMVNAMKPDDTLGLRARAVESTLSPPTTSLPVKNEASQYARTSDSTLRDIQSRQNLDSSKIPPLSATETAEASTASGLSTRWTQIKERFLAGSERNKIEKLLSQHVISDLHSGDPKARARAIKTNDALASAIRNRLKSLGIQSELSRAPVDIEHLQKLEAAYSSAISQAKQIVTEQKYTGSDKKTALTMIKVAEEKLRGVRLDLAQGTNGPYTRIVINGANSKFLDGVKNKLGIDELVFDLESKQRFSTSGASFNGTERRLQIPIETLLDSNKDNLLSDVFLHEISHAAIERKRQAGVRTPYYIKARSIGELPITEMDGYDMFFSIDEINSYRKQIANILRGRTLGKSVTSFGSFKMSMSDYLGSAGIQYRSSLRAGQSISKEARKVLADSKYHKDILIFKESKTPEVHIPIFRDNAIAGYIEITVTDVLPTDSVEEIIRKTNVYLDEVDKMIKRDVESFKK